MAGSKKTMMKRILIIAIVMLFLFGTDVFRIFYLQIVQGDYYTAKAQAQQLSDTEVSAIRGTIYDSSGNVLAKSATVWTVYLDPGNIEEEDRSLLVNGLAELLEYDEERKAELLEKSQKDSRYVVVENQVENDVKEKISNFVSENKLGDCVGMTQTTKRYYPYGSLASSVIGFTGSDDQGLSGLENYYDDELVGTNGRIITAKDAVSNEISNEYETSVEATDGNSLILTINQIIQYYLEKGLRETMEEYQAKGAYGIVMDCNTGAVLAMASLPDYDCNDPYELTYDKVINSIDEISDDEEKSEAQSSAIQNQWRNFTVSDTYVPGSVFKTFMASAALEEGVVTTDTTHTCTGSIQVDTYTMNCHNHSVPLTQTLTQGLANSCNTFFITIGQRLGVHNYFKYFEAFGFTQKTGIDLPGEASPQYYEEDQYGIVELSSASFGQTNSLTPIQVCTGIAAIANGGTLYQPYLVSEIVDADGKTVSKTEPNAVRQVISEETAATVREMMKNVVDKGTGKNGYVAGYSVGGKTGTSTKLGESAAGEGEKYIVSFAAIAPTDDPQIAMLIIMDEPNQDLGGGALCAPIAAMVIEEAMAELNVEPKYTEEEIAKLSSDTPKVAGEELSEVKSALTSLGYSYQVIGDGDTVVRQSPAASSTIPEGGTVYLYTDDSDKKTATIPDFTGLTVSEAKSVAATNHLNIVISGNGTDLSSGTVVAHRQSEEVGSDAEYGTVVTVTFKNTESVLD